MYPGSQVFTHSRSQDISQVRDHYDRSKYYASKGLGSESPSTPFTSDDAEDDFFGMFLGPSMVYTSGISSKLCHQQNGGSCSGSSANKTAEQIQLAHEQRIQQAEEESLEQMQANKVALICRKLQIRKGDMHLDIGCGWGTLANHSASRHGAIVTGVTLSRNQVAYANATAKRLKIKDHRITFWCRDYRDVPTNVGVVYDKISCIEMAEHVGVKNFAKFLQQVRELLHDDGIFLLQIAGLRRAFQVGFLFYCLAGPDTCLS